MNGWMRTRKKSRERARVANVQDQLCGRDDVIKNEIKPSILHFSRTTRTLKSTRVADVGQKCWVKRHTYSSLSLSLSDQWKRRQSPPVEYSIAKKKGDKMTRNEEVDFKGKEVIGWRTYSESIINTV